MRAEGLTLGILNLPQCHNIEPRQTWISSAKKRVSHCVSAAANGSCSSDFLCPSSDTTINGNSNSLTPGLDIVNSTNAIEIIT